MRIVFTVHNSTKMTYLNKTKAIKKKLQGQSLSLVNVHFNISTLIFCILLKKIKKQKNMRSIFVCFSLFSHAVFNLLAFETENTNQTNTTSGALPQNDFLQHHALFTAQTHQALTPLINYLNILAIINSILDFSDSDNSEWQSMYKLGGQLLEKGMHEEALENNLKCLEFARKLHPDEPQHQAIIHSLISIAQVYERTNEHSKTFNYLEEALNGYKKLYSNDHKRVARFHSNLGLFAYKMADYNTAVKFFKESVAILKDLFKETGQHDDTMLFPLKRLGQAFLNMKKYSEALDYFKKSLETGRRVLKYDDPELASLSSDLGVAYMKVNDLTNALTYFLHAHEVYSRILIDQTQSLNMLLNMNHIANVYVKMGHVTMGVDYHRRCLEASINVNEPAFQLLAGQAMLDIGKISYERGAFNEALNYFSEALPRVQMYYKGDHEAVASLLTNTAAIFREMKNHEKAVEYAERCFQMRQRLHGDSDHPRQAESLHELGASWLTLRENAKAYDFFSQALQMRQRLYSNEDHVEIYGSMFAVADSLRLLGKPAEAVVYAERSLQMLKNLGHETNSVKMFYCLILNGELLTAVGRLDEAEANLQSALAAEAKGDQPELKLKFLAHIYNALSVLYEKKEDYARAIEFTAKGVDLINKHEKDPSERYIAYYHRFGELYSKSGENLKAVEWYEKTLHLMQRAFEYGHPRISHLLYTIGNSYERMGNFKRGLEYYTESLEMYRTFNGLDFRDQNFVSLMKDMNGIKEKISKLVIKENDFHSEQAENVNHFREEL
jgi:tetratricopeptide (TPR) repeat protein